MDFSEIFLLKLLKPTVYNEKRRFLIIGKPWLALYWSWLVER